MRTNLKKISTMTLEKMVVPLPDGKRRTVIKNNKPAMKYEDLAIYCVAPSPPAQFLKCQHRKIAWVEYEKGKNRAMFALLCADYASHTDSKDIEPKHQLQQLAQRCLRSRTMNEVVKVLERCALKYLVQMCRKERKNRRCFRKLWWKKINACHGKKVGK